MWWIRSAFQFARNPGKNLENLCKAFFPHLSPGTAVGLVLQAALCLTIYCSILPRLFRPSMYWTEGAVICGLGIVGWYSAILALRNHAIGYVIQGLLTSLICLAASVVVMVASVQSMDNAEFYLRLLIPLSIAVTSFRIALKGLGWARSGYRRMKAEKANLLLPENKVAEPSIDSSVTDQVKVHHA